MGAVDSAKYIILYPSVSWPKRNFAKKYGRYILQDRSNKFFWIRVEITKFEPEFDIP